MRLHNFLISFSQAVSTRALKPDSSVKEKEEDEGEEERRRRKAEDVMLGNSQQAEVDYQVLTPHLNLQDIHAFTESGLKGDVLRNF